MGQVVLNILEAGGGEMDVRCCYLENENLNQSSQSLWEVME